MRCASCGASYGKCDSCGCSVFTGSSQGVHALECLDERKAGRSYVPKRPWESRYGCPNCKSLGVLIDESRPAGVAPVKVQSVQFPRESILNLYNKQPVLDDEIGSNSATTETLQDAVKSIRGEDREVWLSAQFMGRTIYSPALLPLEWCEPGPNGCGV